MQDEFDSALACWERSGVFGDKTCPELESLAHCHNCPDFSRSGRSLFDREIPSELRREWTLTASQPKYADPGQPVSVVVFQVAEEWLAVKTAQFIKVSGSKIIRPVPERSNESFLGLANLSGELTLCFDLARILKLPQTPDSDFCLILLGQAGNCFALKVRRTLGLYKLEPGAMQPLPDTLGKALARLTQAAFSLGEKQVGLIDLDRLFAQLSRSMQG